MIKIVSGYSYPANDTSALVALCNQLNARGHTCVFYGPDGWHVDKCKSGTLSDFSPETGDIIIVNDMAQWTPGQLTDIGPLVIRKRRLKRLTALRGALLKFLPAVRPSNYTLVLTCQGSGALPLLPDRVSRFRKIHFANRPGNFFAQCFRLLYPTFTAPDFSGELVPVEARPAKVAGILCDIKEENRIEAAIERAFAEGMETAILYGAIHEPEYFYSKIAPLMKKYPGKIKYAGFMDDRQKMYGAISDVYSAAPGPSAVVRRECAMTNTEFHAANLHIDDYKMTNDQIFAVWEKALGL